MDDFPDHLLNGPWRWLDKIGLWERWLDQIQLCGRWLEKIRRRWLDKIRFQWRWPERIRGRWFDKLILYCAEECIGRNYCFPMGFNEFMTSERSLVNIELWERWLDKIRLCGRWLDKIRERWLDNIRFERRCLDKIWEQWLDNILFWGLWHLQGKGPCLMTVPRTFFPV